MKRHTLSHTNTHKSLLSVSLALCGPFPPEVKLLPGWMCLSQSLSEGEDYRATTPWRRDSSLTYHHNRHHILFKLSFFPSTSSVTEEEKGGSVFCFFFFQKKREKWQMFQIMNSTKTCQGSLCGFCTCGVLWYTLRHINVKHTHTHAPSHAYTGQLLCRTDLAELYKSALQISQCLGTLLHATYFGCYHLKALSLPLSLSPSTDHLRRWAVLLLPSPAHVPHFSPSLCSVLSSSLWYTRLGCSCLISTASALHGPWLPSGSTKYTHTHRYAQTQTYTHTHTPIRTDTDVHLTFRCWVQLLRVTLL